jgi:hypothetical protein
VNAPPRREPGTPDDPFGTVLPERAGDDDAASWGDRDESADDEDERLRREVPPHHG